MNNQNNLKYLCHIADTFEVELGRSGSKYRGQERYRAKGTPLVYKLRVETLYLKADEVAALADLGPGSELFIILRVRAGREGNKAQIVFLKSKTGVPQGIATRESLSDTLKSRAVKAYEYLGNKGVAPYQEIPNCKIW